jgi:hypothetical protein
MRRLVSLQNRSLCVLPKCLDDVVSFGGVGATPREQELAVDEPRHVVARADARLVAEFAAVDASVAVLHSPGFFAGLSLARNAHCRAITWTVPLLIHESRLCLASVRPGHRKIILHADERNGRAEAAGKSNRAEMTTAAIYARKSTDRSGVADEQKSIARQVEHARSTPRPRAGWSLTNTSMLTMGSAAQNSRTVPVFCA